VEDWVSKYIEIKNTVTITRLKLSRTVKNPFNYIENINTNLGLIPIPIFKEISNGNVNTTLLTNIC